MRGVGERGESGGREGGWVRGWGERVRGCVGGVGVKSCVVRGCIRRCGERVC